MKISVLDQPLSREQVSQQLDRSGFVTGIVGIPLYQVIHKDFEAFLDVLSEALTRTDVLRDVHYQLVGCQPPDALLFRVTGDLNISLCWDVEAVNDSEQARDES